jgi:hypothetical protein
MEVAFEAMCKYRLASADRLPMLKDASTAGEYMKFTKFHEAIGNERMIEAVENTLWRAKDRDGGFFSAWALCLSEMAVNGKLMQSDVELPMPANDPRIQALVDMLYGQPMASDQGSFRPDLENSLLGIHVRLGQIRRFVEDQPEAVAFHTPYYTEDDLGAGVRADVAMLVKGVIDTSTFEGNQDYTDVCLLRLFHLWSVRYTDKRVPWADDHLIEWWELGDPRKKRLLSEAKREDGEHRRPIVLHLGRGCFWIQDTQWADGIRIYKVNSAAHALSIWLFLVINSKIFDGRFASLGDVPADARRVFRHGCKRAADDRA